MQIMNIKDLIENQLWEMLKTNGKLSVMYMHPYKHNEVCDETVYLNGHVEDICYVEDPEGDMILISIIDEETGTLKTGLHFVCNRLMFR